jgi:hypothetical protein
MLGDSYVVVVIIVVVEEQPADGQLVGLVKDAKTKMKLLRQAGTTLDSAQYVSVVNMDDDDPDAVLPCSIIFIRSEFPPPSGPDIPCRRRTPSIVF